MKIGNWLTVNVNQDGRLRPKQEPTDPNKRMTENLANRIGRVGILFGKKNKETAHPYDYYVRLPLLHEFGGDRKSTFLADNGESYTAIDAYDGSWMEAGIGFTHKFNDRTYVYADFEKSFGGTIHKKWQFNVGLNRLF